MEDISTVQALIAPFKKIITVERPGADGGIHVRKNSSMPFDINSLQNTPSGASSQRVWKDYSE